MPKKAAKASKRASTVPFWISRGAIWANKNAVNVETTSPVTQSIEIEMTVPVTQSKIGKKMNMRFFLPQHFSKKTAPEPTDDRVSIIDLPEEYLAVISYSGFASQSNFEKHKQI